MASDKAKVLVVDDNPSNLVAMRKLLRRVDCDLIEAGSGNDALSACLDHDFALVLLDVDMPEMDGYEVAHFLKGEPATQQIPIIFVTAAYEDVEHRLKGYDVGAVDYIQKPIEDSILLSKVSIFLDLYNSHQKVNRELARSEAMRTSVISSETRLRESIVNSPLPIMMHAEDGQVLILSRAWTRISGYTQQDIPNTRIWAQKAFAANADTMNSYIRSLFELTSVKSEGVFEIRAADGHIRLWEFQSQPLQPLQDGRRVVLSLAIDVTERIATESELRISAIAFESQVGIVVTDADATILRVNQAFTAITGYSADEVLGKNPRILSSGRHDKAFYKLMWENIHRGSWTGEIWNRRKNGEAYPIYQSITEVRNDEGNVTNYVATFNDISQSKEAEEEIRNLAFYDPLTRLPNRRLLLERLNHALVAGSRRGQSGALLFIDLDNFKTLNDTMGHDVGDKLLQQVAERLTNAIRENDTVARLGGDEFVVMIEEVGDSMQIAASQVELIGNKLLQKLNAPYQLGEHEYHSTPSIGVALFGDERQSVDELLKQADIAMYQSKKSGRNTIRFFDPKMQETIRKRARLENELRSALDQQQFLLYYQPQVDSTGRLLGAEALIRWHHPDQGVVTPGQFISVAEETGVIEAIGQWVLESACAQIRQWQQHPSNSGLYLSVNVSARQFRQNDFADQVKQAIAAHDIDPGRLKLELTESSLLEDVDETIDTMSRLNELGVGFSLDDFGTGYSSLQYIKRLPIDQLKVDQSFIRDICADPSDKTIVRTIIAMAHSLGLDVIAEGVETEEQLQLLLKDGCLQFQGYLFGKPMPIDMFEEFIVSNKSQRHYA